VVLAKSVARTAPSHQPARLTATLASDSITWRAIPAERIVPGPGAHPGVIVVHDGNGFGPHAIGVANEIAEAGFWRLRPVDTEPEIARFRGDSG